MTSRAYLLVRATVSDPSLRDDFEHWYRTDHLPTAMERFRCGRGWRYWSSTDPAIHYAFYEFPSMDSLNAALESALPGLVAEFDARWPQGVSRTRELLQEVHEIAAAEPAGAR